MTIPLELIKCIPVALLLVMVATLAAFGGQNPGVQIATPDERIVLVRTDQQPANQHHPVLDRPEYARLGPYTVTLRVKGGQAIHAITVRFDVVDQNGVEESFPHFYDMPPGQFVVERGSSCEFWPGGRMYKEIPGKPLMSKVPDQELDVFEHARSVTFSIDYVEFEDGTTAGPNHYRDAVAKIRLRRGGTK
jgi:hypothetical protein